MGPRRRKIVFNSNEPISFLFLLQSVLNFRRVTGMLDLEEFQSLDANSLPSAVYLSPVQTPPPSNYGYFMPDRIRVKQAQIFGGSCSKRKCRANSTSPFHLQNYRTAPATLGTLYLGKTPGRLNLFQEASFHGGSQLEIKLT